jgi:hypothetical protein
LRHQHAVERIIVMARQRTGDRRMLEVDWQPPDPTRLQRRQQILRRLQLPERPLDRDLPGAGGTGEHLRLVGNHRPGLS